MSIFINKFKRKQKNTTFQHYTVIIDGVAQNDLLDFDCPKGCAWMSVKVWAENLDMAIDMACYLSDKIGFKISDANDAIRVFESEAQQPPREKPFGYDIRFTPYNK